jgi:alpha-1,6-mannosyltransferase
LSAARAARASRLRSTVAWGGLAGALACDLVLAVGGAATRSAAFPTDVERLPHPALKGALAPVADALGLAMTPALVAILVLVASACYLLVIGFAAGVPARAALGVVLVLHLALAVAPPLLSADVFGYLAYARLGVIHGLDPYLHPPAAGTGDPLLPFVGLQGLRSPYGPLFTLLTYPLALLGVTAGMWLLKALAALGALACLVLVAGCARRLGRDANAAVLFVGLNPLWLVWAVGGAHNDLIMMAVVMGALELMLRGRPVEGGVAGAVAVALKPTAVVILPFLIAGARRRRAALAGVAGGAAAVVALSALAFGRGLAGYVDATLAQGRLVSHYSVPSALARGLGLPEPGAGARAACAVAGLGGVLVALRAVIRGVDAIAGAGWALLAVVVASTWLYPWYLVWVLPLAGASGSRALRAATLAACGLVLAVRFPLGLTSPL